MSERPLHLSPVAALAAALTLAGAACVAKKEPEPVACPAGQTRCVATCVDLQTSALHCGSCGHACPSSASCSAGTCVCPAELPDACEGAGGIGGACVDLQTGAGGYCGTCGVACAGPGVAAADAQCTSGACVCSGAATDCGAQIGANPRCVDMLTDEAHCGTCGNTCNVSKHWTCDGGSCKCLGSYPNECSGACVNFSTDAANCGGCGSACAAGRACCSSTCKDLASDESSCGACGIACAGTQTCCSGACRSLASDASNCGTCGKICPTGATCSASNCVCPATEPVACGSTCCAGTQCCGTGSGSCQPAHSNGLGGTYYFGCSAAFTASETTHDAAVAAADSWHTGTTYDGNTSWGPYCVGRQTATQCAVWCWAGSSAPGKVGLNSLSTNCNATNPAYGATWN